MVKSKKVQQENDDSGAVLLGFGAIGIGVWAWLRSREAQPAPAVSFVPRSQARSQPVSSRVSQYVDFNKPRPQFGYADRQAFGFLI